MHWLNKIALHHKEWIKIAVNFGARDYAEDIVQEAYIRVHKYSNPEKFIKNGKVNKGYMFFIIRNNWHFYEKGIFKIYRDSGLSIRGIAKETKISSVNIFHTLKKSKKAMRDLFGEDYEDYLNGEYDLID